MKWLSRITARLREYRANKRIPPHYWYYSTSDCQGNVLIRCSTCKHEEWTARGTIHDEFIDWANGGYVGAWGKCL